MITSYRDLDVYNESYQLFLEIHTMTKQLPETESYEIGRQLRKAAMSIPMNIAEGYGKKESTLDFKRFLRMSMGSCNEVVVLLDMCKDLSYITQQDHSDMTKKYEVVGKRLNMLIQKWKSNL